MNREDAERITTEHLGQIYGFALRRCRTPEDAEDLSQEIAAKVFSVLLRRDDIDDPVKFLWTAAHNALANYYRDNQKHFIGVPIEDAAELISDGSDIEEDLLRRESEEKLRREIAYLSSLQRKIVIAYYFENKKQADIAAQLGIPAGTVKWHLFEAKKELKRGMDMTRHPSDLKFNPIKFNSIGINGSAGTKTTGDFFRSPLNQNICYAVRNRAKTISEIADDLGVSPVYVEAEAEYLEEYGLLNKTKDGYIVNFIISEPTRELLVMQDAMYKKAAAGFANDLYDELVSSGILDDSRIRCHQSGEPVSLTKDPAPDRNFILWSLIPYIAAQSGEDRFEEKIPFESVATIRPDGGHNIIHAAVVDDDILLPDDYVYMNNWCGPMWNQSGGRMLWQIDSEWSDRGGAFQFRTDSSRVLSLYEHEEEALLSRGEYAWLCEKGYMKVCGDPDGMFKAAWQVVFLEDAEIKAQLLAIGAQLKEKYAAEFEALKAPYVNAVLDSVPAHLRRVKEYELQYVFHSDGWFLLHCIRALLDSGRLKEPEEHQRKALMTLILPA
ncbi:MAG: sigma-70 family RNA polymerase sigma factor [Clostridia bacterium]|nr:sigma-70 family RNA polymerase sigma factor [Clostridia bacterium]